MFDPVCFLHAFLLCIPKVKTGKRTQMKILEISEKQRLKLGFCVNFLKKKQFLHFKTTIFFLTSFCSSEGVRYFWVELYLFFPIWPLQPTNNCLVSLKAILERSSYNPPLYELLVSVLWLTLSFDEVPCRKWTNNLGDTFHCRHTYNR